MSISHFAPISPQHFERMKTPLQVDLLLPLRRVADALAAIETPGAFFTSGALATDSSPALVLAANSQQIQLPITQSTAETVIAAAKRAPYGHGEATLVDTAVRNTWELNPSDFQIGNAQWQSDVIKPLAHECARRLGVAHPSAVDAKLYKLLVYEVGGKFERH